MSYVLLIDDDPGQLVTQVRQAFPAIGHRIAVAGTGAEGVAHVRATPQAGRHLPGHVPGLQGDRTGCRSRLPGHYHRGEWDRQGIDRPGHAPALEPGYLRKRAAARPALKRELAVVARSPSLKELTMTANLLIPNPPKVIIPPFTLETATKKVRLAEDAWNSRDLDRVVLGYTKDSVWRNRSEFVVGRDQIRAFLARKWAHELDYRLVKALWAFTDTRIAVRFQYEWHDDAGPWYRSYGNELWEFDEHGLTRRREASINDVPILEPERKFFWPAPGPRPADHPGIPDVK
jgi:nuclear transport factor 2 (NTF2) superfamily protein